MQVFLIAVPVYFIQYKATNNLWVLLLKVIFNIHKHSFLAVCRAEIFF